MSFIEGSSYGAGDDGIIGAARKSAPSFVPLLAVSRIIHNETEGIH